MLALPIIYIVLLLGQPAGLDLVRIVETIRSDPSIILQQLIIGLSNGAIIAIIALGYTLVYGIIELVNFAHGDVFMLGTFISLLALAPFIYLTPEGGQAAPWWAALLGFIPAMAICALINVAIERVAYRRLRNAPRIVALISAIGMSFILQNIGLQLASFGKLATVSPQLQWLSVLGTNNAAPKSFPTVLTNDNLLDLLFPSQAATTAEGEAEAELDVQATMNAIIEATLAASVEESPTESMLAEETLAEEEAMPAGTEEATPEPMLEATPEVTTSEGETMAVAVEEQPAEVEGATEEAQAEAVMLTEEATEEPTPTEEAGDETMPADELEQAEEDAMADLIATVQAEQAVMEELVPAEDVVAAGRIRITLKDVLVISVAVILMVALRWFVQNTRLGKAMRATAQNRDAARIMGIDIDRIIALTFAIGGALAGAAGMMTGIYNGTAVFTMGFTAGLRAFTAAVLGGIGNITGAALGGILIGILAAFSDQFFSVRWTNAWVFLILVVVLIFRPTGLLGQEGGEKA
ncbi:MAG: ABC transporter permease subunit [Thermoflexales bacterium]